VPVVDQQGVADILSGFEEMKKFIGTSPGQVDTAALRAGLAHNTKVIDQLAAAFIRHPKPTEAFIKETWEDCPECKEAWQDIVNKIRGQAVSPHVVSSMHVRDCPECQKVIADMLQPPAPAPMAPESAPAEEAAKGEGEESTGGPEWPWDKKRQEAE
jgi:hypothetical protein